MGAVVDAGATGVGATVGTGEDTEVVLATGVGVGGLEETGTEGAGAIEAVGGFKAGAAVAGEVGKGSRICPVAFLGGKSDTGTVPVGGFRAGAAAMGAMSGSWIWPVALLEGSSDAGTDPVGGFKAGAAGSRIWPVAFFEDSGGSGTEPVGGLEGEPKLKEPGVDGS